ncbi:MAG: hypothetical protein QG657_432 [Acidobacteriota bacterium]|nr:hypothetical protein [Acidobacteriota bacterium]
MIKVVKDFDYPPAILLKKGCLEHIKKATEEKNGRIYSSNNYGHADVLKQLKDEIYHGKCSYCESKSEHVAALQVEHFRPKKELKKEKQGDESHNGYYWLGYEWSNLLLGCPKCNGKGGKSTRFPISGKRVYDGSPFDSSGEIDSFDRTRLIATNSPLIDEKPLLLNPEYDEPGDHLEFDNLGQIKGITERGDATIKICKLNRDALYMERQKVLDPFVNEIKRLIYAFEIKKIDIEGLRYLVEGVFDAIVMRTKPEEEYSLWGRYIFKKFEYCVLSRINSVYHEPIREAFKLYCNRLPVEEKNFLEFQTS